LSGKLFPADLSEASHCRPPARRVVSPDVLSGSAPVPIPGQHRSLREPRVRNRLPRSTLDRSRRLTPSQLSRVISSDWPYWTGIARGPGRLGSITLLPNDWAAVYFSGMGDTLGCLGGGCAPPSASRTSALRRRSGLASH